ncbi:MAG: AsmA family protein [Pseudomonadota bacterium]
MSSLFKKFLILVFILVALSLIIIISVTVFVDINQYKDKITQLVKQETGLQLEINSEMSLSLWSGLKFKVGNIKLSNKKSLIADIDSLTLGVDLRSLYAREPKVNSVELKLKQLNLSRDKKGQLNFLSSLNETNKHNKSAPAGTAEKLFLSQLSIENIHLLIQQFNYSDKLESQTLAINDLDLSISLLPIIENSSLVIDDPRVVLNYNYSGKIAIKKARINHYQIANLSLNFKDQKGDLLADKIAFSLLYKNTVNASENIAFDALGKLKLKMHYPTPAGTLEPLWTQPEQIRIEFIEFKFPGLRFDNEQYQLNLEQAFIAVQDINIYEKNKYVLDDLILNSMTINSKSIQLNVKAKDNYVFKKLSLQLKKLPVMHNAKVVDIMSHVFLKKIAQQANINVSIDNISNKKLGFTDLKLSLIGKQKNIELSVFSFKSMGAIITADGLLNLDKKIPQWKFKILADKLNLQAVADLINLNNKINGHAIFNTTISGTLDKSRLAIVKGKVHVSAHDLTIKGLDIDKMLTDFENSQRVGLLDVAAVTLLGPAGILITKGNDYRVLADTLTHQGTSKINHLNSEVTYAGGVVSMADVAFSSAKHLLAVKGKINSKTKRFEGFEVATVNKQGCSIYKEQVLGRIDAPTVKKVNVLVSSVVNPIVSLLSQVTKVLKIKCEKAFYTGIVKSPVI